MGGDAMGDRATGYVLQPDEVVDSHALAGIASTGGAMTVIASTADGGAPPHVHTREDEAIYVVAGTIAVRIGDETREAPAGSFAWMPRGVPHAWDVVGEPGAEATVLMITVPAMLEVFLARFHAAATWAEREAVAAGFGITFLPG
jgi:quercetin dioxygenase-like cupin family protein